MDTVEISSDTPVQFELGDGRFTLEGEPVELATKADIDRLEAKVDFMITTFEHLGATFEGAIGEFANGPMGKLFGKLMGG